MRKEYTITLSSFVLEFFNAIDDFFSNYTSQYTLIDSRTDRRVYHNIDEELDLIFYNVTTKYQTSKQKIILVVTSEYDATEEIWYQNNIVCSGKSDINTNFTQDGKFYICNAAYYFPAPTIKEGQKLICNYNTDNNTFMFTIMRNCVFDYSYTSSTVLRTESLFFGTITKYLSFSGGFFYGGDFVNTYERFYRESVSIDDGNEIRNYVDDGIFCIYDDKFTDIQFHRQPPPINHTVFWSYPWQNNPYQQFDCACRNKSHFPEPNNVNRFNAIMRVYVDNAPNRRKNNTLDITDKIQKNTNIHKVIRNNIWAVTMELNYYVPMVCSITSSTKPLPRYEPLIAHTSIEQGNTVNTLNNITMIMPLWFMVRRDPEVLNSYSGVGKNDVINFVDMFNMASDRMENGTFPIKNSYVYDCFHMGNRRSMFGMKGYSGIAFMQEYVPYLDLLDLKEMQAHIDSTDNTPLLNKQIGDKLGYGGDTMFLDMTIGSFILKRPYTDYLSITFEFTNSTGSLIDSVTWSTANLNSALRGSSPFNLWVSSSASVTDDWSIQPFSGGSTVSKFICSSKNGVLTGIQGNM